MWLPVATSDLPLLCLTCEGSGAGILQQASDLLADVLGGEGDEITTKDNFRTEHPNSNAIMCQISASHGSQCTAAIGSGANVKTRKRAAKLALAITLVVERPPNFSSQLLDNNPTFNSLVCSARKFRKQLPDVPASTSTSHTAGRWRHAKRNEQTYHGEATIAVDNSNAALVAVHSSTPQLLMPLPSMRPLPPPPPPSAQLQQTHSDIPEECITDPFMELRPFNGGPLWPYCTACGNWSDLGHIKSQKHTRRLTNHIPICVPLALPSPPTANTSKHALPAYQSTASAHAPAKQCSMLSGRAAPDKPGAERIFNWNMPFVLFSWENVECAKVEVELEA